RLDASDRGSSISLTCDDSREFALSVLNPLPLIEFSGDKHRAIYFLEVLFFATRFFIIHQALVLLKHELQFHLRQDRAPSELPLWMDGHVPTCPAQGMRHRGISPMPLH